MISVEEMRVLEKRANKLGITNEMLMETAGFNACRTLDSEIGLKGKRVLVFCGTGNNAGDGLVFARHAVNAGASVSVHFVKGTDSLKELPLKNYDRLRTMREAMGRRGKSLEFVGRIGPDDGWDMLVDAMLGTGISGEVRGVYAEAIGRFNSMDGFKVALDCPSGIDADTGKVLGVAVLPDLTVTFHDIKPGLNEKNSGRIVIAGIGIPDMK